MKRPFASQLLNRFNAFYEGGFFCIILNILEKYVIVTCFRTTEMKDDTCLLIHGNLPCISFFRNVLVVFLLAF